MNEQQPVTWRLEADGPARRLAEQVLAAADEYHLARIEQDTADAPRWNVRAIAANHEEHRDDPDTAAAFLDHLAERLTLDDVRALRLAGEAAVAATPRAIKAARDRGMKPPRIAAELGLTPSRVYQVVRELAAAEEAPPVGEYRLSSRRPAGDQ